MSEQKRSFMEELDLWTEANITGVLFQAIEQMSADGDPVRYQEGCERVKRAIRQKMLESYHNGQKAGPRKTWPRR